MYSSKGDAKETNDELDGGHQRLAASRAFIELSYWLEVHLGTYHNAPAPPLLNNPFTIALQEAWL
jgi:hypothetical protein